MEGSSASSAIPELYVEERLFNALVNGPLEQSEGLLDSLEEVDVRIARQRTLLHVGVSLGKVDWVEELLARGADTDLEDGSHLTVMSSADEMLRRFPEDSNRRQVMRLVRMVNRRDQAMRRRLGTSSVRCAVSSIPPVVISEHMSAMASRSSSMDALKEEMCSLRAEMRSSLEELKGQVCGLDALLQGLEAAVTSSAEQLTSLNGSLEEETTLGALGTTTLDRQLPPSDMTDEQRECVDGMMRRTEVVYGGVEGVRRVRRIYDMLYDEDDSTACLFKFLHRETSFVVKVDCDSAVIGRIKVRFVDLDGRKQRGSGWPAFAEFSSNTVYLGAAVDKNWSEDEVAGYFADALAQMSLHLCFNNGGKPYEVGDGVHEAEWKRVLEEAEEEYRKRGVTAWMGCALDEKTQTAKDCVLAASVPLIIARDGSTEGTDTLREQVPLLFDYYKEHVEATLLAKARE